MVRSRIRKGSLRKLISGLQIGGVRKKLENYFSDFLKGKDVDGPIYKDFSILTFIKLVKNEISMKDSFIPRDFNEWIEKQQKGFSLELQKSVNEYQAKHGTFNLSGTVHTSPEFLRAITDKNRGFRFNFPNSLPEIEFEKFKQYLEEKIGNKNNSNIADLNFEKFMKIKNDNIGGDYYLFMMKLYYDSFKNSGSNAQIYKEATEKPKSTQGSGEKFINLARSQRSVLVHPIFNIIEEIEGLPYFHDITMPRGAAENEYESKYGDKYDTIIKKINQVYRYLIENFSDILNQNDLSKIRENITKLQNNDFMLHINKLKKRIAKARALSTPTNEEELVAAETGGGGGGGAGAPKKQMAMQVEGTVLPIAAAAPIIALKECPPAIKILNEMARGDVPLLIGAPRVALKMANDVAIANAGGVAVVAAAAAAGATEVEVENIGGVFAGRAKSKYTHGFINDEARENPNYNINSKTKYTNREKVPVLRVQSQYGPWSTGRGFDELDGAAGANKVVQLAEENIRVHAREELNRLLNNGLGGGGGGALAAGMTHEEISAEIFKLAKPLYDKLWGSFNKGDTLDDRTIGKGIYLAGNIDRTLPAGGNEEATVRYMCDETGVDDSPHDFAGGMSMQLYDTLIMSIIAGKYYTFNKSLMHHIQQGFPYLKNNNTFSKNTCFDGMRLRKAPFEPQYMKMAKAYYLYKNANLEPVKFKINKDGKDIIDKNKLKKEQFKQVFGDNTVLSIDTIKNLGKVLIGHDSEFVYSVLHREHISDACKRCTSRYDNEKKMNYLTEISSEEYYYFRGGIYYGVGGVDIDDQITPGSTLDKVHEAGKSIAADAIIGIPPIDKEQIKTYIRTAIDILRVGDFSLEHVSKPYFIDCIINKMAISDAEKLRFKNIIVANKGIEAIISIFSPGVEPRKYYAGNGLGEFPGSLEPELFNYITSKAPPRKASKKGKILPQGKLKLDLDMPNYVSLTMRDVHIDRLNMTYKNIKYNETTHTNSKNVVDDNIYDIQSIKPASFANGDQAKQLMANGNAANEVTLAQLSTDNYYGSMVPKYGTPFNNMVRYFLSKKRSGDQLQVLACGRWMVYRIKKAQDTGEFEYSYHIIKNTIFVSYDQMAIVFAILNNINCIYENDTDKSIYFFKAANADLIAFPPLLPIINTVGTPYYPTNSTSLVLVGGSKEGEEEKMPTSSAAAAAADGDGDGDSDLLGSNSNHDDSAGASATTAMGEEEAPVSPAAVSPAAAPTVAMGEEEAPVSAAAAAAAIEDEIMKNDFDSVHVDIDEIIRTPAFLLKLFRYTSIDAIATHFDKIDNICTLQMADINVAFEDTPKLIMRSKTVAADNTITSIDKAPGDDTANVAAQIYIIYIKTTDKYKIGILESADKSIYTLQIIKPDNQIEQHVDIPYDTIKNICNYIIKNVKADPGNVVNVMRYLELYSLINSEIFEQFYSPKDINLEFSPYIFSHPEVYSFIEAAYNHKNHIIPFLHNFISYQAPPAAGGGGGPSNVEAKITARILLSTLKDIYQNASPEDIDYYDNDLRPTDTAALTQIIKTDAIFNEESYKPLYYFNKTLNESFIKVFNNFPINISSNLSITKQEIENKVLHLLTIVTASNNSNAAASSDEEGRGGGGGGGASSGEESGGGALWQQMGVPVTPERPPAGGSQMSGTTLTQQHAVAALGLGSQPSAASQMSFEGGPSPPRSVASTDLAKKLKFKGKNFKPAGERIDESNESNINSIESNTSITISDEEVRKINETIELFANQVISQIDPKLVEELKTLSREDKRIKLSTVRERGSGAGAGAGEGKKSRWASAEALAEVAAGLAAGGTFTGATGVVPLLPPAAQKPTVGAAAFMEEELAGGRRRTRRRKHHAKNRSKKASRNPKKMSKRHLTRSTFRSRHRL